VNLRAPSIDLRKLENCHEIGGKQHIDGGRVNSQPRSIPEYIKRSRDNFYRANSTFLVCKKKMLGAIGRATLVIKRDNGETGSAGTRHTGARHTGVKINKTVDHRDIQLTYPQGKRQESLQRVEG
jgi:hypothetical protein